MELRGLEPLTPTLPGLGEMPDQAQPDQFPAVVGVVGRATVVRVVVRTVVSAYTEFADETVWPWGGDGPVPKQDR